MTLLGKSERGGKEEGGRREEGGGMRERLREKREKREPRCAMLSRGRITGNCTVSRRYTRGCGGGLIVLVSKQKLSNSRLWALSIRFGPTKLFQTFEVIKFCTSPCGANLNDSERAPQSGNATAITAIGIWCAFHVFVFSSF